jgi:hypothetical protein
MTSKVHAHGSQLCALILATDCFLGAVDAGHAGIAIFVLSAVETFLL